MSPEEPRPASDALWQATDALLDRATIAGVLAHRLAPLEAARLRRLGRTVPEAFRPEERAAMLGMRTGIALVERIRASCDDRILLIKGPEVARLYPSAARRFSDIDIVTSDAPGVYRRMLESGFVPAPDERGQPAGHHHLEELRWPTISLRVEVHSRPGWLESMRPPSSDEILEAAEPSGLGVAGMETPTPLHHALILAVHAWGDEPLQTIRDLLDVEALATSVDPGELERTARAWGVERVWRTTRRAIDCLFYAGAPSLPLRTWARHLPDVRERSVLEHHLTRWLSPYGELPPRAALAHNVHLFSQEIAPAAGEGWREKLGRTTRALRNPRAPVSRRDQAPTVRDPGTSDETE